MPRITRSRTEPRTQSGATRSLSTRCKRSRNASLSIRTRSTRSPRLRNNQAAGASRWALATIAASQFAPPFMVSGVAVALPAIGTDLGAGATSLGLVETLFLAGAVGFLLPAGRLVDAGDKASLFKFGLLAFGMSSLLVGLLSSIPLILLLRFVQGGVSAVGQV